MSKLSDIQKLAFDALPNTIQIERRILAEAELELGFPSSLDHPPGTLVEIRSAEDGHGMTCMVIPFMSGTMGNL